MRFVEIMDSLSTPEQLRICLTLLKRFHPKAAEMADETMTLQEQQSIHQLDEARLTLSKAEERIRRPNATKRVRIEVDRKKLKKVIDDELVVLLGDRKR